MSEYEQYEADHQDDAEWRMAQRVIMCVCGVGALFVGYLCWIGGA